MLTGAWRWRRSRQPCGAEGPERSTRQSVSLSGLCLPLGQGLERAASCLMSTARTHSTSTSSNSSSRGVSWQAGPHWARRRPAAQPQPDSAPPEAGPRASFSPMPTQRASLMATAAVAEAEAPSAGELHEQSAALVLQRERVVQSAKRRLSLGAAGAGTH